MNWKSTVLVSGVGVVATWVASIAPPARQAGAPQERPAPTTGTADISDEIVREAERLSARLHPPVAFQEPSRNPFRFTGRARAAAPGTLTPAQPEMSDEPLAEIPETPTLRVNLTGVIEDTMGGTVVRTAVLSTSGDVLLVKEGDVVAGQYKVTAITATTVELTRESDGVVVRLAIRP